jgi:hypothetical protein
VRARTADWLPLAFVLIGALALYLPGLRIPFCADDFLFLDQVRGRSLWDSLWTPDPIANFFRPVSRQLYFFLLSRLGNESPLPFRIASLLIFLVDIGLLAALARRIAGARAAIFAAALFALHYSLDVPVRWASGSQELLAIAGALAAILLYVTRHRLLAGLAMMAAAFSKEVVLLTPLIAILADHVPGESWGRTARRAWPLVVTWPIWVVMYVATPNRHVMQGLVLDPRNAAATFLHLAQVVIGIEWLPSAFGRVLHRPPPFLPLLAALAAVVIAWRRPVEAPPGSPGRPPDESWRHSLPVACVWILVAIAPLATLMLVWSAYYYAFAIAGVALALGILLARAPVWGACAVLALLSWGSANGRFAPLSPRNRDPWTPVSNINRSWIENGSNTTAAYVSWLRRTHPELPHGSTVFFSGIKPYVLFQRGNGPALRWAYRDTSLRSYFLGEFSSQTVRPGPLYVFMGDGDSLLEVPHHDLIPWIAFGMIVSDKPEGARDALDMALREVPQDLRARYWHAWVSLALEDTATARSQLAALGFRTDGDARELAAARARAAAGDTAGAIAAARNAVGVRVYDAEAHGLLANALLSRSMDNSGGVIESYAARVLAPREPFAWKRWAVPPPGTTGAEMRMGTKLFQVYLDAGLPAPQLMVETPVGGGADWPGYEYLVATFRSLLPALERLTGLDPREVDIETLTERLRDDVVSHRAVQMLPLMFGAWARKGDGAAPAGRAR